ncbi:MAG: hypothetical protein L6W00_10945 [Lentisphaeria bacterium]|nr:MAG: hypothetical protein L6W00_10945 [Lentisphaeria bacterium]
MRIQRLLLLLLLPALPAVAAEYSVGETRLEFEEGRGGISAHDSRRALLFFRRTALGHPFFR